jgi:hypothetical protein
LSCFKSNIVAWSILWKVGHFCPTAPSRLNQKDYDSDDSSNEEVTAFKHHRKSATSIIALNDCRRRGIFVAPGERGEGS